jgi:FkbM family methyltransferase
MLIDISHLFFIKDVKGIIHIGAHDCEERMNYLMRFNNITDDDIIWFEAFKDKFLEIKNKYKTVIIHNECISDNIENIIFRIYNNSLSNSIYELKEHINEYPNIREIDHIEIQTKTLKKIYDEHNLDYNKFNFMKLSIKGAELNALKGAENILENIDFIYTEINTKELFKNCAQVNDIDNYLKKFNFKRIKTQMTLHGWGDAFYSKFIFQLANNYSIYYGSDEIKLNITEIVREKCDNNNISHIPIGDERRSYIYSDPHFRRIKKIFIESNKDIYIIEHNHEIFIDNKTNKLYLDENPI